MKIKEKFWEQKAKIRWFSDGDKNSKFFHSYVKGRRKKLYITEINDRQGNIIHNNQKIREEAVEFCKEQFAEKGRIKSMLDCSVYLS